MAKIDVNALNDTYRKASGQAKPAATEKAAEVQALLGIDFGGFDDVADTFCEGWAKAKPWFKLLLKIGGWVLPASAVATIKGIIAAVDANVIPVVCAPDEPAA